MWATATTAASNGSVNSAHEGYSGFGAMTPLTKMMTGEVIFGGVGSGLYGMLLTVLLTVFLAGLMVGRTPEYLGKKIQAREVKLVAIGALYMPVMVLIATALAIATPAGQGVDLRLGPAGVLGDPVRLHLPGQQQRLGVRRLHRVPPAQRARQRRRHRDHPGHPARRRVHAARPLHPHAGGAGGGRGAGRQAAGAGGAGHVPDRLAIFIMLLIGVIVIVAALSFLPALALGPVVQGLTNQLF